MKKNYIFRIALLLFVAAMTGQKAMAQGQLPFNGSGTAADPYEIGTLADWNNLADSVAKGISCSGMYFIMKDNIGTTENPVTKPLGKQVGPQKLTDRRRFAGHFDGNNKTLTVNITNEGNDWFYYNASYCAPFAYVQNVTIQDLHVTGTITTTGQFASGLVGQSGPDDDKPNGVCTISNCHVSVNFVGNTPSSSNGNHGTFISIAEGAATITNCWFDGKLTGKNYYYSGGFIGLNKGTGTTLTNCLFNPSEINIENNNIGGSSEFVHDNKGSCTLTDCYYTKSFSEPLDAQGKKVVATEPNIAEYTYSDVTAADGNDYYIIHHNLVWMDLQAALNNSTINEFYLNKDLDAGDEDEALVVPANKTFCIYMNDHALDRALDRSAAKAKGYVIKVETGAQLTIEGGTICGGHNTGQGGGIYNAGKLNLNDVTITGNYANSGGGVYHAGTLLAINGNVQINGNTKNNVYLASGKTINVSGNLDASTSIGVTKQGNTGVFTADLSGNGTINNFFSDDTYYLIIENADGEAVLKDPAIAISLANSGDNTTIINDNDGILAHVTLSGRTIYKDGLWNTICLPFNITYNAFNSAIGGSTEVRRLTAASVTDGTLKLTFTKVTGNTLLEAGKPYIVKGTGDNAVEPTFNRVTIKKGLTPVTFDNITFKGTYSSLSFASADRSILFMGVKNGASVLYYPGTSANIGTQRAYFELDGLTALDLQSNIKAFVLDYEEDEDDPTAIMFIYNDNNTNDDWYSLDGKKLSAKPTQKGIYVNNGKKIIIK